MNLENSRLPKVILLSIIPVGTLLFYIFPSLISLLINYNEYSVDLLVLSCFTCISFILIWNFKIDVFLLYRLYRMKKYEVNFHAITNFIVISYVILMTYVIITAPSCPLFDAIFKGYTASDLALGRETFLRTRVGWEFVLNYLYTMYRTFLMPFAICYHYNSKGKYRHFVFMIFLFTLTLTLEKAIYVLAFIPLIFLFKNKPKVVIKLVIFAIMLFLATSFLATRSVENDNGAYNSNCADNGNGTDNGNGADNGKTCIPNKYQLIKDNSLFSYVINRTIYIPYATSIDWLRYKQEVLGGEYTYGMSISLIPSIFGRKKINLEREIFAYEYGQKTTGTGSANTVYFVDSYMNFGFISCFIYNIIIVFIIRLTLMSKICVLRACLSLSLFYLLFVSLSAMLFSGALSFLVLFAMFLMDKDQELVRHDECLGVKVNK